jgi:hypothetical protein
LAGENLRYSLIRALFARTLEHKGRFHNDFLRRRIKERQEAKGLSNDEVQLVKRNKDALLRLGQKIVEEYVRRVLEDEVHLQSIDSFALFHYREIVERLPNEDPAENNNLLVRIAEELKFASRDEMIDTIRIVILDNVPT